MEALYTLLEDGMETDYKWCKDESFVAELKEEERQIKSDEIKGYTEEEAKEIFYARINKRDLEHV